MCHSVTVSHHGYQKFLTDTPGPEFPVPGGYPTHQNSASVNSPFRRELVIGVLRRPPPPCSAARCTPPWSLHARHRTDPHCSFAPSFAAADH